MLRTLSSSHPVYAMLNTILKFNVGNIIGGKQLLLSPQSGYADQQHAINSTGVGVALAQR
jgi:hypothetical protein